MIGLDDEKYGTLRGHILAMDPLPDLDRIYNLVCQEEHHKRYMIDCESKSKAAITLAINRKHPSRTGEHPVCTHCGKTRHGESGCYEIIGYPSHWSNQGRGRGGCGSGDRRGGCWSGVGSGHGGRIGGHEYAAAATAPADIAIGRTQETTPSGLTND